MEQAITEVACTASGLLQTNTRKPQTADKPWDLDGGKMTSWIGMNMNVSVSLLFLYFLSLWSL